MTSGKFDKVHRSALLETLRARFARDPGRHPGIEWDDVAERLQQADAKLAVLHAMEESGGEPDVVGRDDTTGELIFFDCAKQSPKGRRSVCFDPEALESRKKHKPKHSAVGMAREMGIELLTEEEYRRLQQLGEFDTTTSSWIATPKRIRDLGGALFCDRRFDTVFTYHNGAESYYAARGFRGSVRI